MLLWISEMIQSHKVAKRFDLITGCNSCKPGTLWSSCRDKVTSFVSWSGNLKQEAKRTHDIILFCCGICKKMYNRLSMCYHIHPSEWHRSILDQGFIFHFVTVLPCQSRAASAWLSLPGCKSFYGRVKALKHCKITNNEKKHCKIENYKKHLVFILPSNISLLLEHMYY